MLLLGNIFGCYVIVILCSFTNSFITVNQKDEIRKRVTSFSKFCSATEKKRKTMILVLYIHSHIILHVLHNSIGAR